MSAISQKSISGITSITSPAGTDDQISLHTSNTNEALKIDGAGNLHLNNHVNTTGVTTASNFKTGSSNLHSTGLTVGDSFVHSTGFNVGSNIKLGTTGIITATSFVGDGSDLTNLPAGLGTALSATASSPLNKMYYTNQVLGVPSSVTVDVPASASKAYTQYADIKVESSADLIVAEGDDLIPDVLGLADFGTFGGGASAGRIRVNSISNAANDGSPTVQKGLVVTGVCTATSFSGSGANLTSLPVQATIANNADNRVITGGSGVNLNAEANLTMGNNLQFNTTANGHAVILKSTGNYYNKLSFDSGNTSAGGELAYVDFSWDGDKVADILALAGSDTTNKDDGHLVFRTSPQQGNIAERLRITSGGYVNIGGDYTQTSYNLSITNTGGNLFRLKTANEGDFDLRFMIQNSESNIWHYGTDDLTFGARYDRKVSLIQNGSKRLTINGDLIGINNTSPAKNLHVTSSGVATLRIETTDSRGQAWDLLSTNGAGSNTGTLSFRDESGSAYLEFGANGGSPELTVRNGGANDLLVVDNNGNVNKPRNAFAIIHTNSGDAGVANNKIKDAYAVFTGVHLNQGSHYNTSNGRFTCPVAGVYGVAFSSNLHMSNMSVGNSINIQTRKNGSIQLYNYNTVVTTIWQQMTFTNYVNCNANDYLQIYYGGSQTFGADQGSGQWGHLYFWLVQ
nr:hypothetical protein [uncultured Mediterranean phage uvMED]